MSINERAASNNKNINSHIFHQVFARVLPTDWRDSPDKNEYKHDFIPTCTYNEEKTVIPKYDI